MNTIKPKQKIVPVYAIVLNKVLEEVDQLLVDLKRLQWEASDLKKDKDILAFLERKSFEEDPVFIENLKIQEELEKKGRVNWTKLDSTKYNEAKGKCVYMARSFANWERDLVERIGPLRLSSTTTILNRVAEIEKQLEQKKTGFIGLLKTVESRRYMVTRGCSFVREGEVQHLLYGGIQFQI